MFKPNYQNMFQIFQYTLPSSKEKNIILEPLCCIFRMILLKYKDPGIKISITANNSIEYMDSSLYQGILRTYNGDTRDDLHNLYNPFLKAFEWYNNDDEEMPDLEELQEKWKKSRNQEYRASMAKERLRRKLENKRKVALNQQRFQEKSSQRKGTNNENSNLVENKEE